MQRVLSLHWSADGDLSVAAVDDTGPAVHIVIERSESFLLTGHSEAVTSVAWSADGTHLATGGNDSTVRIWRVAEPS